jgi:hypothetical protein
MSCTTQVQLLTWSCSSSPCRHGRAYTGAPASKRPQLFASGWAVKRGEARKMKSGAEGAALLLASVRHAWQAPDIPASLASSAAQPAGPPPDLDESHARSGFSSTWKEHQAGQTQMLAMKAPQQRRVVRRQRSGRQAQGAAAAPAPTQAPGAAFCPANAPVTQRRPVKNRSM